jgi:hypothetical protein
MACSPRGGRVRSATRVYGLRSVSAWVADSSCQRPVCYIGLMPLPDLIEDEHAELAALLRAEIKNTRWPLAPRTRALRAILDKLELPAPRLEPLPAPKPIGEPSLVLAKRRRRRR